MENKTLAFLVFLLIGGVVIYMLATGARVGEVTFPAVGGGVKFQPPSSEPTPSSKAPQANSESEPIGAVNLPTLPLEPSSDQQALEVAVTGLRRGSRRFTLNIANTSSNTMYEVPLDGIAIGDDVGNGYGLDPSAMQNAGLPLSESKTVPPGGKARIGCILQSAIAPGVKNITLVLQNIWAGSQTSAYKQPIPSITKVFSLH